MGSRRCPPGPSRVIPASEHQRPHSSKVRPFSNRPISSTLRLVAVLGRSWWPRPKPLSSTLFPSSKDQKPSKDLLLPKPSLSSTRHPFSVRWYPRPNQPMSSTRHPAQVSPLFSKRFFRPSNLSQPSNHSRPFPLSKAFRPFLLSKASQASMRHPCSMRRPLTPPSCPRPFCSNCFHFPRPWGPSSTWARPKSSPPGFVPTKRHPSSCPVARCLCERPSGRARFQPARGLRVRRPP
mmetsp:Transcript_32094/g.88689  ORF Transcript_32094/g.88689 Transcript_32094/m.88689 type:complete len:236 (+) Transcript_32094:1194-1901(+)